LDDQGVQNVTTHGPNLLRGFRARPDDRLRRAFQEPPRAAEDDYPEPGSLITRFLDQNLRPGQSLGGIDMV
jgi:hypothetical protein